MFTHFEDAVANRFDIPQISKHGLAEADIQSLRGHPVFQAGKPFIKFRRGLYSVFLISVIVRLQDVKMRR